MLEDYKVRKPPVVLALFVLYTLAILFLLVIPNSYRTHNVLVGGLTWEQWEAYIAHNWNLVPFRSIGEQMGSIFAGDGVARNLVYLAGNILGFVPLGFFLPSLISRQRRFAAFVVTVVLSVTCLELAQLMTMRGSFDIDDIILNTGGACLGFWILRKSVKYVRDAPHHAARRSAATVIGKLK